MTYTCECCNIVTEIKANYDRHLKTKRHLTKVEISPTVVHHWSIIGPSIYDCKSCNKTFASQSSLSKHHKRCVFVQINDLQKQIKDKDKQLENNNKQLQQKVSENKDLKNENKELTKTINKIKDKQLNVLQKNLKPANTNNSQVIINNYPNAPNIGFPENIPIDRSLNKYVELGGIKGLGKFISDHWAKNINHIDRSIWMVDPSRNKFLIRYKDSWVIDIDGTQFQELNLEKIQSIFNEYLEKQKLDTYDYLKTIEFITDIRTKNMIIRGLKDAGKYLVYDKEKFTDFETIENEIIQEPVTETIVD